MEVDPIQFFNCVLDCPTRAESGWIGRSARLEDVSEIRLDGGEKRSSCGSSSCAVNRALLIEASHKRPGRCSAQWTQDCPRRTLSTPLHLLDPVLHTLPPPAHPGAPAPTPDALLPNPSSPPPLHARGLNHAFLTATLREQACPRPPRAIARPRRLQSPLLPRRPR